MRNFKKISAVVVAFAITLTTLVPAFAAYTPVNGDKAVVLNKLDLYAGTSTSSFVPALEASLTRGQGAVVLAKLFNMDDAAMALTDEQADGILKDFADAGKVPSYAKKRLAYLVDKNIMSGSLNTSTGKVSINADDSLLGGQFATLVLKQMGYAVPNWTGSVDQLSEVDGAKDIAVYSTYATKSILRDHAVGMMYGSLTAYYANGSATVIEKIVEAKPELKEIAEEAGLIKVDEALKVEKIVADNLRTLRINLNKPVDSATVTTSTVKVTKDGTDVVSKLDLTSDNKTIVVTYTAMAQSQTVTVTVDGVKAATGESIKAYAEAKVVNDVVIPEAIGASVVNQKQIEVYFNEPMNFAKASYQVLNNIKIDGVAVIAKATPNDVKNTIVFDFPTALKAGAHTISIADVSDFAGYKALIKDFAVNVEEDTAAPVLTNAVVKNVSNIEVTFNEKLDAVGTFEVNGVVIPSNKVTEVANSNGTKFNLELAKALDLSALVEVNVKYVGQVDVAGNKVETSKIYTFKVDDDVTLPSVSASIEKDNKIVLTFTKTMSVTDGAITVKDSDGKVLGTVSAPFAFKSSTNNTILEISASNVALNDVDSSNILVNVKNMKDSTIRGNLLPEANLTLTANDTKKPTVDPNFFAKDGTLSKDDTVTFYFSESMDEATLKNLSNYVGSSIGSLAAKGATIVSIAPDATSITINVDNFRSVKDTEKFTVYAIKDLNDNMMTTARDVSKLASTSLGVTGVETADGQKIKVTFNTKIASIDPSALKIQTTEGTDTAVFINVELAADKKSAIFTANKNLGTDTEKFKLVENNASLIKNIYAEQLVSVSRVITDKVSATVKAVTGDASGEIKITFSEAVGGAAFTEAKLFQDLIVRDKDGNIVDLAGNVQFLLNGSVTTANAAAGFDTIVIKTLTSSDNYTVSLIARNVKDISAQGNLISELLPVTIAAK